MKISTTQLDTTKHSVTHHYSSTFGSHVFVNMSAGCFVVIDDEKHWLELQNGHSYVGNDYSLPSNKPEVYEQGTSELLSTACENYDDPEELAEFGLSEEDALKIKEVIDDKLISFSELIDIELEDAKSAILEDDKIYVGNMYEADLQQFDSEEAADDFSEKNKGYTYFDAQNARDTFPEFFNKHND